jgi:CRISPR system Cascade subunit CasE
MTMYLTQFRFNTARRGARALLGSPQALHAAVLDSFARAEDHTTGTARTLWRLDHHARHDVVLYLVSPGEPDLTHLVEQAGWPTTETWQTRAYQPFLNTLECGQSWAFRLTANPVHNRRPSDAAPDTKRFGAVTVHHQIAWLTGRAERHGFAIAPQSDGELNLYVHRRNSASFTRKRGERPVTVVSVSYDGVLTVTDPEVLRHALTNGIGQAKAYGCGLMTLAHAGVDVAGVGSGGVGLAGRSPAGVRLSEAGLAGR